MKYKKSKLLLTIVMLVGLYLSIANTASADPTVNSITTDPEKPKPLSTFKVIADISGDNIIEIKVTASECDSDACYENHINLPMTLNEDGKYETEITLKGTKDSIDHVQYVFIINDDGTEYTISDNLKTNLDVSSDSGTNSNSGDNGSPGFELIFVIIAVMVGVLLYRKKR